MKTLLEEIKDRIANLYGYKSFKELHKDNCKRYDVRMSEIVDQIARIHTTSQIEDLTKEVERLKKLIVPETGRQFEINRLKSENDRYREALEDCIQTIEETGKDFDCLTSAGREKLSKYKELLFVIK